MLRNSYDEPASNDHILHLNNGLWDIFQNDMDINPMSMSSSERAKMEHVFEKIVNAIFSVLDETWFMASSEKDFLNHEIADLEEEKRDLLKENDRLRNAMREIENLASIYS